MFKSRFRQNLVVKTSSDRSSTMLGNGCECHGFSEMIGDDHINGYPVWWSLWHHKCRVWVKYALHRITESDDKPQATYKHTGIMLRGIRNIILRGVAKSMISIYSVYLSLCTTTGKIIKSHRRTLATCLHVFKCYNSNVFFLKKAWW